MTNQQAIARDLTLARLLGLRSYGELRTLAPDELKRLATARISGASAGVLRVGEEAHKTRPEIPEERAAEGMPQLQNRISAGQETPEMLQRYLLRCGGMEAVSAGGHAAAGSLDAGAVREADAAVSVQGVCGRACGANRRRNGCAGLQCGAEVRLVSIKKNAHPGGNPK